MILVSRLRSRLARLLPALVVILLAPGELRPGVVPGGGFGIECSVEGSVVTIRWSELPIDVAISGFRVSRDGQAVAKLGPDALSYREEAPDGKHIYVVEAVTESFDPDVPGELILVGRCEVVVGNARNVKCSVEGGVVTIEWTVPPNILALAFIVGRNNEIVARPDADARAFRDDPPPGEYIYTVSTDNTLNGQRPPDFLIGSCRVVVDGDPGLPPPRDLTCSILESFPVQVQLAWRNGARYDAIVVVRDGEAIAELAGDATRFREVDPGAGVHVYEVSGVRGDQTSQAARCRVETDGGGRDRLSLRSDATAVDDAAIPHADTVTAVLENVGPIQGWSFGVCSDPSVLVVDETSTSGTTTASLNDGAGPSFIVVTTRERGVTMAVVIDELDPLDTLPAGEHTLLHIRYRPGPDAELGQRYGVEYCATLGEPPVAVVVVARGFSREPVTSRGVVVFSPTRFIRADANNDGAVDMSDGIFVLDWLFRGGKAPPCLEAADANATRAVDIADGIYVFQGLFAGGPPPPFPFPECGATTLFLGCEESACER